MQMLFGSSGVWKFDKFHKLKEYPCYKKKIYIPSFSTKMLT